MRYNANMTQFEIGAEQLLHGNKAEALAIFQRGADAKDPRCIFGVALMYYHGWGVKENRGHAKKLFNKCSGELHRLAKTDGEAAYILARCYDTLSSEKFTKNDDDKALDLLEFAAEKEYPEAMYWLGVAYIGGTMLPVMPDWDEAEYYLKKCADLGMPSAMNKLASLYDMSSEDDEAAKWRQMAIEYGYDESTDSMREL